MSNPKGSLAGGGGGTGSSGVVGVGGSTNNNSTVGGGGGPVSGGSGGGGIGNIGIASGERHPTLVHRKVAILGFRAVGKSAIVNSFVSGSFSESYHPTIESTFHKTIRFRKVHFQTDIVDTAGMVRTVAGTRE
jgi:Ras family